MRDNFFQIKKLVVENVLSSEHELKGLTGAEKKTIVVEKVLKALASMMPWYIRWGKELVAPALVGRLVDLAVRSLNFMTGWNFSGARLSEKHISELTDCLDAPFLVVADSCQGDALEEKIDELHFQYAALPAKHNSDIRLSANLSRSEVACRDGCGFDSLARETVDLFQGIRDYIGRPILVNSGCRCPERNVAVGGARNSQHMCGVALDIRVSGWSNRQLGEAVKEAHRNVHAVREYLKYCEPANTRCGTVVHIDTGRVRGKVFAW